MFAGGKREDIEHHLGSLGLGTECLMGNGLFVAETVGLVNNGWSGDDSKAGLGSVDLDLGFNIQCAQPSTRSFLLGSRQADLIL